MTIDSRYDSELKVFSNSSLSRPEGCHASDIYYAVARDLYPKWFKTYDDDRTSREVSHFEKGLVLEETWGDTLSAMIGAAFSRPLPRQVEGVWCSPDGFAWDGPVDSAYWPKSYPGYTAPAIHECKVTLKSSNQDTSPITHEKFCVWHWQVMMYCYAFKCHTAYLYSLHLCGDYKDRPWTPTAVVHRFDFTADELAAHWAWMLQEAKTRGLLHAEKESRRDTPSERDASDGASPGQGQDERGNLGLLDAAGLPND